MLFKGDLFGYLLSSIIFSEKTLTFKGKKYLFDNSLSKLVKRNKTVIKLWALISIGIFSLLPLLLKIGIVYYLLSVIVYLFVNYCILKKMRALFPEKLESHLIQLS